MKNILNPKISWLGLIFTFLLIVVNAVGQAPQIDIVYPKKDATIEAVDSSFILGSVTPGSRLIINNQEILVHEEGGFLAFLPLKPGQFIFDIKAINNADTSILFWPVNIPEPLESFGYDILQIADLKDSTFSQILAAGDRLIVEFQATPFCFAWFSIPGIADSIPMAEIAPISRIRSYTAMISTFMMLINTTEIRMMRTNRVIRSIMSAILENGTKRCQGCN